MNEIIQLNILQFSLIYLLLILVLILKKKVKDQSVQTVAPWNLSNVCPTGPGRFHPDCCL